MGHGFGNCCHNNIRTQCAISRTGKLLCNMFSNVKVFEAKLSLLRKHNTRQTVTHCRSYKTWFRIFHLARWLTDAKEQVRWRHSTAPKINFLRGSEIFTREQMKSECLRILLLLALIRSQCRCKQGLKSFTVNNTFSIVTLYLTKTYNVSESNCFRPQVINN
jgi:hypothetical protein